MRQVPHARRKSLLIATGLTRARTVLFSVKEIPRRPKACNRTLFSPNAGRRPLLQSRCVQTSAPGPLSASLWLPGDGRHGIGRRTQ